MGKNKYLKNLIAYLLMIIVNILAGFGFINGISTGEISNKYSTLFTPAGYAFSIWGLIYFLLFLFVISPFKSKKNTLCIDSLDNFFIISCLLNILWIFLWHGERLVLSLITIILLLFVLFKIYGRLSGKEACKRLRIPFTFYFSWILIASIANLGVVLKSVNIFTTIQIEGIWACSMMILAAIIAVKISINFVDPYFLFVPIWAYIAIYIKNGSAYNYLAVCSLGLAVILLFQALRMIWPKERK